MNDERFERELRGFLTERAPGPASPALRSRLHAVTVTPPLRMGGLSGWLGGAGRTLAGVATVGIAAVLLALLLTRPQTGVIDDPNVVGGPSTAPAGPRVSFINAPDDLFSAAAVADADRRLDAIFQSSGIEGRLIVQAETSTAELSTPPGWPDRYDADGNGDLDVSAVFGVAPDGTVICCLIDKGALIERAQAEGYWRLQTRPDRIRTDLESQDRPVRDAGLERFVTGIEGLKDGMPFTRDAVSRESIVRQSLVLVVLGVLAASLLLTRSRWAAGRMLLARDAGDVSDLARRPVDPTVGDRGVGVGQLPVATDIQTEAVRAQANPLDAATAAPVPWAPAEPTAVPRDRILIAAAAAALAGVLGLGLLDVLRPRAGVVPMDTEASAAGLANAAAPVVPIILLGVTLVAMALLGHRRARARRVAILGLVAGIALVGGSAVFNSRPTADPDQRSWVAGLGAGPDSKSDTLTYPVRPGEPFTFASTVRNPGSLPITILGLDGVQTSQPNPYLASIVGLGWIVQPVEDGTIHVLSANPSDASVAWPVTLAPGQELGIVLLGRGGPCAEPTGQASSLPFLRIQLAYRVLGIERSDPVALAAPMFIPEKTRCTVSVPGGTITYGP